MTKGGNRKPTRGARIVTGLLLWVLAPIAFFLLGLFFLGPWYAQAGWFRPPPSSETNIQSSAGARQPWYDEAALPDRLGPVGDGFVRSRTERGLRGRDRRAAVEEEPAVSVQDYAVPEVPEGVPVYEEPPPPEETVQPPDGTGLQPPDTLD